MTDHRTDTSAQFQHWALKNGMAAECPYCHDLFFAPAGYDPLKKHFDLCDKRLEEL